MNYQKVYDQLVEKCKPRGLDKSKHEGYFEIHHIVPRCLGGSDEKDNLVMLSAREHYIAHMLLWKIYPDVGGLTYAAFMMSVDGKSSRVYSKLRNEVSSLNSERNTGKLKIDWTGFEFGRLKVIKYLPDFQHEGKRLPKWECLCRCGNTCYLATAYIKRQRILSCGCFASESKRGRFSGKEKSEETRIKIAETLKNKNLKPWENCKLDGKDLTKWIEADYLFSFWVSNNSPKSHMMTLLYNSEHGTDHKRSYFKILVQNFIDGWVPNEDPTWFEFKKGI